MSLVPEQVIPEDDPKVVVYRLGKLEEASNEVKRTLETFLEKLVTREHLDFRIAAVESKIGATEDKCKEREKDLKEQFDRFRRNTVTTLTIVVGPVVAGVVLNWINSR